MIFADQNEIMELCTSVWCESVYDYADYHEWMNTDYFRNPCGDGYEVEDVYDILTDAETWQFRDIANRTLYFELHPRNEFYERILLGKKR